MAGKQCAFSAQKAGKRPLFSATLAGISTLTQWKLCMLRYATLNCATLLLHYACCVALLRCVSFAAVRCFMFYCVVSYFACL